VTIVGDAPSNSAITDDNDFGSDGKYISCSAASRLHSFYV
jgi:hypothetical protein